MPESGNLDFNHLRKARMGNFDEGILVLPICVTDSHTDSWGGGRWLWVVTRV